MQRELTPIPVTLDWREMSHAALCGVGRTVASLADRREPGQGTKHEDRWRSDIEGACGEMAAAKALNRFWSPSCNTFMAPDIGQSIGVRTRSDHSYDLIIRERDNPDYAFVLVTGIAPSFLVHGWRFARDCRRDEWLKDYGERGHPCWGVPQAALMPIQDLVHALNGK
jgi:hypothetical protein